ncbi:MAG: phosphotransferase [Acidobacteriota bacterium]|nr:phosphotransferase [Acidobacteriota bacterium]
MTIPEPAPPSVLIDPGQPARLERYLADRGWLKDGETVRSLTKAGEGNMNLTLRVDTGVRTMIVKQGRPWVEKYPAIPAPPDRTAIEADWYALVERVPRVAARMPRLLGVDRDARVLALSDLGPAADFLGLYGDEELQPGHADALIDWMADLHRAFEGDQQAASRRNRAMRELNHEHIFEVPLRAGNGLDLDAITPGLRDLAAELRSDQRLTEEIRSVGQLYLAEGRTLLHGDYYPGSWLQGPQPWVIDPEFGFYGHPEFDLGVMLAHLHLADQPSALTHRCLERYRDQVTVEMRWVAGFAGVEVIRRLLGVAQLPLSLDLAAKRRLLAHARNQVLEGCALPW